MNRSIVIAGAAIIAGLAGALYLRDKEQSAAMGGMKASEGRVETTGTLHAESVLAIRPRAAGTASAASKVTLSPLVKDILDGRPLKPIYDRLLAKTDRTGEEDWALAATYRCVRTTEMKKKYPEPNKRPPVALAERRAKFAAALPANAKNREQRLAAFDSAVTDPCEGFPELEVSDKDIRALLDAGSAKGDLKARAMLIERQWMDQIMASNDKGARAIPVLGDADLASIKDIVSGPDPVAADQAFRSLLRAYGNLSLRTASTDEPVDMSAMYNATSLLGCEYGNECGRNSRTLQQACAMQGRCDIGDLREYTFFYTSSPASSQLVEQYMEGMRQARRGDWSYFTFHPGPTPSAASWR